MKSSAKAGQSAVSAPGNARERVRHRRGPRPSSRSTSSVTSSASARWVVSLPPTTVSSPAWAGAWLCTVCPRLILALSDTPSV